MSFDDEEDIKLELLSFSVRYGSPTSNIDRIMDITLKATSNKDFDTANHLLHLALKFNKQYGGFLFPIDRRIREIIILRPEETKNIVFSKPTKDNVWLVIFLYDDASGTRTFAFIWRFILVPHSKRWFASPLPLDEYQNIIDYINVQYKGEKTEHGGNAVVGQVGSGAGEQEIK